MDKKEFIQWFSLSAKTLHEEQEVLTALDTEIGDGDHGLNMQRGFSKVEEKLAREENKDLGSICKTVGMTLLSTIGGASGPLYGTFFLKAAGPLTGKETLDTTLLADAIAAGVAGITARGKAVIGEKTMIDVWLPVSEYLQSAKDQPLGEVLTYAAALAQEKAEETIPMVAKKGRASYLGERSVGHKDPGAASSALLIKTLAEALG